MRRISWQFGAVLMLLFAVLAAGAVMTIQPAKAQAPYAMPSGAPAPQKVAKANSSAPQLQGSSKVQLVAPPVNRPDVVLYDQFNNASTAGTLSQQFEPANAAFNAQLADDFPVPGGQQWSVQEVDIAGV